MSKDVSAQSQPCADPQEGSHETPGFKECIRCGVVISGSPAQVCRACQRERAERSRQSGLIERLSWALLGALSPDAGHQESVLAARLALKAIREPTEDMIEAALHDYAAKSPFMSPFGPAGSYACAWRAMIDAALGPQVSHEFREDPSNPLLKETR
jgi:hypothetical protein